MENLKTVFYAVLCFLLAFCTLLLWGYMFIVGDVPFYGILCGIGSVACSILGQYILSKHLQK